LEIHGYQEGEIAGMEARMFAPENLGKPLTAESEPLRVWRRERLNVKKDGMEFPVQLTSIPSGISREIAWGWSPSVKISPAEKKPKVKYIGLLIMIF
jgi:hypothetical protein